MPDQHVPSPATRRGPAPGNPDAVVVHLRQTPAAAALPPRVHLILGQLLGLLSTELGPELDRLLTTLDRDLFRQAESAHNPTQQSDHLQNIAVLHRQRDAFVPCFMEQLENALVAIRDPDSRLTAEVDVELPSLDAMRLIDDDESNEDTLLRSIASRHQSRAGLPLLLLGMRFGVLAGAPAFDAAALPIGPRSLARLLARATEELQLSPAARLQLYELHDRKLMASYPSLVDAMNALLASANVLPGLTFVPLRKPQPNRSRGTGKRNENQHHAESGTDGANDGIHGGGGGSGGSGSTGAGTAGNGSGLGARGQGETGTGVASGGRESGSGTGTAHEAPGTGGSATASTWSGSGSSPDGSRGSAADPNEAQALSQLRQLMAQRHERLDKGVADPTRPLVAMATMDVDAALRSLQTQPPDPRSPSTVSDIRQALLAQSRSKHDQGATLSREDSDTFELLGMLYTEIGRELREGTQSKALLERLQVPLLRVALQNRAFFVRQQHPARQLLNAVAEAGAVWLAEDETDLQLRAKLQGAVDHVTAHYDGDAAVFDSANRDLQEHLRAMAHKAKVSERRQVDAAQGREKLELAKRQAAAVIEKAVNGRSIPKFLASLLEQAWSDALTLVLLRNGEASEEWKSHVDATSQIIDTCVHNVPMPDELATRVKRALALVGYHEQEARAITRSLATVADDGTDPASRTELAMKLKASARLGSDTAQKPKAATPPPTPLTPRERACYEHLRTLPFGTWIEFTVNYQGDRVRRRLAWYSPATGRTLFVNQRGQRIDDATAPRDLTHLARLVTMDQARLVPAEQERLVDRAWQAALAALRGITGRSQEQPA